MAKIDRSLKGMAESFGIGSFYVNLNFFRILPIVLMRIYKESNKQMSLSTKEL